MDTLVAQQSSQVGRSSNGNGLALGSVGLLDFSDTDTFAPDSCDKIDAILNKIDAELINMHSKRVSSTCKYRLSFDSFPIL